MDKSLTWGYGQITFTLSSLYKIRFEKSVDNHILLTPPKFNTAPENDDFQKVSLLFQVPC